MPLPNRVTPFGTLEPSSERGLFFGNRGGRFHDAGLKRVLRRPWASRQWIICLCAFKGRETSRREAGRKVWDGTRYTELFFCDEVTALAAGHRPCMECRRADTVAFRRATVAGGAFAALPSCPELDARLDAERRDGRAKRLHLIEAGALPDGAMLALDGMAYALKGGALLRWSHAGYGERREPPRGQVPCLTLPATLAALRAGYRPLWHPGAAPGLVRPAPARASPSSP